MDGLFLIIYGMNFDTAIGINFIIKNRVGLCDSHTQISNPVPVSPIMQHSVATMKTTPRKKRSIKTCVPFKVV